MALTLTTAQTQALKETSERLHRRFTGTFGRETIQRLLEDSLVQLLERASYGTFVPLLVERFAAERLHALAQMEGPATDTPTVLFLCVQNAGRSQMAAGWAMHLGGDDVVVRSGGSAPAGGVHPVAVEVMAEVGIDISSSYPKPWTEETIGAADVVVTMGCGDACPVVPGKRYLDWELTDPAGLPLDEVRAVRDDIRDRVSGLLAELGVATKDARV